MPRRDRKEIVIECARGTERTMEVDEIRDEIVAEHDTCRTCDVVHGVNNEISVYRAITSLNQ